MAEKVIIFYVLICSIISCSTKPSQGSRKTNVNNIFSIEGQCTFDSQEDKDAFTGNLWCGNIALKYNYSKESYSGPLTQEEEFGNAFKGNYYVKFFEKIHIDSKLNRMFIDSVMIKKIDPIESANKALLFPCSSCNKVAALTFRNRMYFYPFYSNSNDSNNYNIKVDTLEGHYRKIFFAKTDSLQSGVFLRPLSKNSNQKNLSIFSLKSTDVLVLEKMLKSVHLLQNK
jgi:hypothetical protein